MKLKSIDGINGFFELDEPLYGLAFLWLVFSGPGKVSLDSLIWRYFSQQTRSDGSLPGSSKAVESS